MTELESDLEELQNAHLVDAANHNVRQKKNEER
jgi:hypothetical protein